MPENKDYLAAAADKETVARAPTVSCFLILIAAWQ